MQIMQSTPHMKNKREKVHCLSTTDFKHATFIAPSPDTLQDKDQNLAPTWVPTPTLAPSSSPHPQPLPSIVTFLLQDHGSPLKGNLSLYLSLSFSLSCDLPSRWPMEYFFFLASWSLGLNRWGRKRRRLHLHHCSRHHPSVAPTMRRRRGMRRRGRGEGGRRRRRGRR